MNRRSTIKMAAAFASMLALAVSIVATVLAVVSLRHRVHRDPLADLEARVGMPAPLFQHTR